MYKSLWWIDGREDENLYYISASIERSKRASSRPVTWMRFYFAICRFKFATRQSVDIRVDRVARSRIFRIEFLNRRELFVKKRRQIADIRNTKKEMFELCIIIFIDSEMNTYIYGMSLFVFRVFSKFLNS